MSTHRKVWRSSALLSLASVFALASVNATQDAVANGGTRSLTIYHVHTKEQETVTYKSFGSFNSAGLQRLNWLLRDWRQDEPTRMDPQLFDILWEVYRASGSSSPIHVVSAYRSPGTNAMLARRSRGVAKNSQHMSGKAIDFNLPDVSMATVRDIGLRLQNGGVGYYPRANNPWVHLDTGGVRHWPKVSREHLVRLFPDERTVHIPRDGKPLAGFETARAIIEARGGTVSSGYIDIAEGRATGRTLFQILFGGGEGDDDGDVVASRGKKGRTAVASRNRNTQMAALPDQGEGNALAFFNQPNSNASVAARQEAPALRPARPTRPTPIEEPKPATAAPETPKPAEQKPAEQPKPVAVAALQPGGQQVPLTTRADAEAQDKGKLVQVSLPPRRPANFAELVAAASGKPILVTVQLPPSRPTAFASASPETPAAPAEEKPIQTASIGRPVNVMLPQPRPAAPAALQTAALQTAAVGLRTEPLPAAASSFAPQPAPPAGRIIPAAPAAQTAAPSRPAAPQIEAKDRKGLDSLIAQVAMASGDSKVAPVATPSVAAISAVRTVTGRFEPKRDDTPASGGFTGSAIRPMGQGFR